MLIQLCCQLSFIVYGLLGFILFYFYLFLLFFNFLYAYGLSAITSVLASESDCDTWRYPGQPPIADVHLSLEYYMSGSSVAVQAGACLRGRWLLPRVRQHSALSAVSWRSHLLAAANTQQLRRQSFFSRWTSLVELSFSAAAQSRHHLRTVQMTAERTPLREAWTWRSVTSDMRCRRKNLLTYILTYLLTD